MAKGGKSLFSKGTVDANLDQLFSNSLNKGPLKAQPPIKYVSKKVQEAVSSEDDDDDDESLSELGSDEEQDDLDDEKESEDEDENEDVSKDLESDDDAQQAEPEPRNKRKRSGDADLEDKYLAKLARIEAADEERIKRQKSDSGEAITVMGKDGSSAEDAAGSDFEDEESDFEIPQHETQDGSLKTDEVERANRTVFVGNVSTDAIKSKESMKELKTHLSSFFEEPKEKQLAPKIESIRFRSVAFASTALPRKAAFAKKELMDATTKSTNAYVVYSSPALAKIAVSRLNGTIVLSRHIRVDSVAHPAPVDHRRCVFVGNLGFVDDESLMQDNGQDDDKKPKKKRRPGDMEEGLWREFGKVGMVESVRVIRDKSTRVGKGFAYVQFTDQVAVEKALELNDKKFPPMLPRSLRVTRAKKMTKTNSYQEKNRRPMKEAANGKVYNPKVDPNQRSVDGRAKKMFGRAEAAQAKKGKKKEASEDGFKRPEQFVFEGHRARNAEGKGAMNLKPKKEVKGGKPQSRSSRRGAAFKAAGGKKKTPSA